jgi:hypothetical protein
MDGPVSVQRGGHGLHVEGWRSRLLQIYEKRFLEGLFIKKVFFKKIKIKKVHGQQHQAVAHGPNDLST